MVITNFTSRGTQPPSGRRARVMGSRKSGTTMLPSNTWPTRRRVRAEIGKSSAARVGDRSSTSTGSRGVSSKLAASRKRRMGS
jgi:hypothetical protein